MRLGNREPSEGVCVCVKFYIKFFFLLFSDV